MTRYSKFCEQRERRIWKKQFGELFCSIFVSYKSPVQLFPFCLWVRILLEPWLVLVVASSISFKITLSYFSLIPLLRLSKSVVQQCVRFCVLQAGAVFLQSLQVQQVTPIFLNTKKAKCVFTLIGTLYRQYKSHRLKTDGFVLYWPKHYATLRAFSAALSSASL